MSNSPLVSYTKISPHKNVNRNHKIDTITIHCVVGQCSVETLGNVFSGTRKVSSNYGIGTDGRVGMYVEEKDRSWCSSSSANDHRAITIEVASDTKPPYAINEKAYKTLIKLCADICKRNGIKELKWKADKSLIGQVDKQNMTVHRWFANTACPGEYIYGRLGQIAKEVNSILGSSTTSVPATTKPINQTETKLYKVQTGAFTKKDNALALRTKVKVAGFDAIVNYDGKFYRVQVGAYKKKANAENTAKKLKALGFDAVVV